MVHTLGPVYGSDRPEAELLAACYRNSLARAEETGVVSIGFPAVSTGIFGYPVREAAGVAMRAVRDAADAGLSSVRLVRFVLFSSSDTQIHVAALRDTFAQSEP